jgi:hypothetical protein
MPGEQMKGIIWGDGTALDAFLALAQRSSKSSYAQYLLSVHASLEDADMAVGR